MKWVARVARVARHCIAVTSGRKYIYPFTDIDADPFLCAVGINKRVGDAVERFTCAYISLLQERGR